MALSFSVRRRIHALVAIAALAFAPLNIQAQDTYPARPINLIVPLSPGGGTDIAARILDVHAKNERERYGNIINSRNLAQQ